MTRKSLDPLDHLDDLSTALRSLPRDKASEGFTAAVLERLDDHPTRRSLPWVRPLLAAAALVTLVAGLLLIGSPTAPAGKQQNARLQALESERQKLETELAEIRDMVNQAPPREIYLGGDERVEVVFDVGWSAVQRANTQGDRSGITPASYPMRQSSGL